MNILSFKVFLLGIHSDEKLTNTNKLGAKTTNLEVSQSLASKYAKKLQ
jgi:hypothetical protein